MYQNGHTFAILRFSASIHRSIATDNFHILQFAEFVLEIKVLVLRYRIRWRRWKEDMVMVAVLAALRKDLARSEWLDIRMCAESKNRKKAPLEHRLW